VHKLRSSTGFSDEQLDFTFQFIIGDSFWSSNCQSPAGLLGVGKNGVRKIDNVIANIKNKYKNEIKIAELDRIIEQQKAGTYVAPPSQADEEDYAF
jgi:hypothetical protein